MLNRTVMLLAVILASTAVWAVEPFPQRVVENAYKAVSPTLCLVSYSYEENSQGNNRSTKRNATALGIVVQPDGLVMVRGHMAIDSVKPYNIRVKTGLSGEVHEYTATFLGKPEDLNIGFLRIQSATPLQLPSLKFASNVKLPLGEPVLVLGVLAESLDFKTAFQSRFVSAILDTPRTTYALDTPVPVGFIGGPAIDRQGRIVGVMGYDLSPEDGGDYYVRDGHPLLYQADLFAEAIRRPPGESDDASKEDDAWLGVFTQPLTDDLASYWGLPQKGGVVVSTIVPGSPADRSGMVRGDVIVEFNGQGIHARQDRDVLAFTRVVRDSGLGKSVPLKVLRDGAPVELAIELAARPKSSSEAQEFEDTIFGITVRELTTDVRMRLNIPDTVQGVIVWRVRSGSWADLADIPVGLLILRVNDEAVPTTEAFKEITERLAGEKPSAVTVFGQVRQETQFFRMEPKWPVE